MVKKALLNVRLDQETKERAEELYALFGIKVTDAVIMFLRQSIMVGGLPFKMKVPRYEDEMEATRHSNLREMISDVFAGDDDVA